MGGEERSALARQNFLDGYNCCQSVVLAFCDLFEQGGVDRSTLARMASPLGGGMGRLREVCGAVSAMFLTLGLMEGYDDPSVYDGKMELYAKVQDLAERFRDENGSIICRELLGLGDGADSPQPQMRTDSYYKKRPCSDLCASAARILGDYLQEER